jgi:hypothetical protein
MAISAPAAFSLLVVMILVEFFFLQPVFIFFILLAEQGNVAILAATWAAHFFQFAFQAVSPGISTLVTELSSHAFTSSLPKVALF